MTKLFTWRTRLSFEVTFPLLVETLLFSQRFSTKGGLARGPSLCEHYPASTVLCPLRLPGSHFGSLAVTLVGQYFRAVEELPGSPTFTCQLWLRAVLYDPGGVVHSCPFHRHAQCCFRATRNPQPPQKVLINGAQSLQPYGLRPAASLSTLNLRCYQRKSKTRYGMCWVSTFPVALSATSGQALRGTPSFSVM